MNDNMDMAELDDTEATIGSSPAVKPTPVDNGLLKKEFLFQVPIPEGETVIKSMTVTEPTVSQKAQAERQAEKEGNGLLALLLQISDLPQRAAKRLKLRDLGQVKRWLDEINAAALDGDGLSLPKAMDTATVDADPFALPSEEIAKSDDGAFLEPQRTFKLLVPRKHDGGILSALTVFEPDLEAATAAARFKYEVEQTSAMVAVMSRQTIPAIGKLAYRDMHRIEAWMAPFVEQLAQESAG